MRTVAIIQCRYDSERLPGKALEKIGDATVLAWVVYRTRMINLDEVVVATTDRPSDDPVVDECRHLDVEWFRGATDDVLDRYRHAAIEYDANYVLRVTADCPMLDPLLNQRIIDLLVGMDDVDYVAGKGWPEGIAQEAFTYEALARAFFEAKHQPDREHVVPYMIRNLRCSYIAPAKCSIDTPQELESARALYTVYPEIFENALSAR